jgi:adenylosuccinate lyase
MRLVRIAVPVAAALGLALAAGSAHAQQSATELFSRASTQQMLMRMEVALAKVQARRGIIPKAAAEEIERTASIDFVPPQRVAEEQRRVGHPLVALINVWAKVAQGDAGEYIHYGATTQDIYDTVQLAQCREAARLFINDLRDVEEGLLKLAHEYRATPMIGRTVGRHALPFTFGVKVSSWLGENRRNIERLKSWLDRSNTAMLSGAVGSYAALGKDAFAVEAEVAKEMGTGAPFPADWKGARDMYGEYGAVLAITSKSLGRMGQEVFLLLGDDFGELEEPTANVGSSTMPHKVNPSYSRTIVQMSRVVPAQAQILLDWMISIYERDQISNADTLGDISASMERATKAAVEMVKVLKVHPENMARNLDRTHGLIMAEEAMFILGEKIGKHTAHEEVRLAARAAWEKGTSLIEEIEARPELAGPAKELNLAERLDPQKYLGLSPQATDRTIAFIKKARETDAPALKPER